MEVFGGQAGQAMTFTTPKPTELIERILEICADNNALILDLP